MMFKQRMVVPFLVLVFTVSTMVGYLSVDVGGQEPQHEPSQLRPAAAAPDNRPVDLKPRDTLPLYRQSAQSKAPFCALIPVTAKPKYRKLLDILAQTLGRNEHVNSYFLFNGADKTDPPANETYKLCEEIVSIGPRIRCHISDPWGCGEGRKCVAKVIFSASKDLGRDLSSNCDWVIKLDPDCIFIPNAALEFVRHLDPLVKVFYGTFSGKLVYSGFDHLWLRTQMPKGNWMASIATWRRMQAIASQEVCSPNHEYTGTDEAAALLCAWYSYGADCITNWREYVRIGPARETPSNLREHVNRVDNLLGKDICIMLIHKYDTHRMISKYNELQSLDHSSLNELCGPSGTNLQRTDDYDFNRAAVGGFKFPNKTAIDAEFDCADQTKLPNMGVRTPPRWVIQQGKEYTGPTGAAAAHFTERMYHPLDKGAM